jgi:hypothetical protein
MISRTLPLLFALLLSAVACSGDDSDENCPEPTQSIVAPTTGPDLSSVPACNLPEPEEGLSGSRR